MAGIPGTFSLILVYEYILDKTLLTRQPKRWQKQKQPTYSRVPNTRGKLIHFRKFLIYPCTLFGPPCLLICENILNALLRKVVLSRGSYYSNIMFCCNSSKRIKKISSLYSCGVIQVYFPLKRWPWYLIGQKFRHQAEISTLLSNFCLTFVFKYWTKFSTDKIFDTKLKFRHFCPTNFCPMR